MIETLRDPAWQFVGAALALIAVLTTFIIYWLQRNKKSLSYEVISKNQLLTVREELEGKLQVLYEGQSTRDICLLVVKLFNSGNMAICSSDYERPVSFNTGASSKILSAAVTEVEPQNILAELSINESLVSIKPVLLNPRDSITLKLLISDFCGSVSSDGRIIGVKSILNSGKTTGYQIFMMAFSLALFVIGIILTVVYEPKPSVPLPTPIEVKIGIVLLAAGYISMALIILMNKNVNERIRSILFSKKS